MHVYARLTSRLMAMTDMFRLDGKVVVVTGGSRGIGAMMARGLLQAGATVYLSSRKKNRARRRSRRVVR